MLYQPFPNVNKQNVAVKKKSARWVDNGDSVFISADLFSYTFVSSIQAKVHLQFNTVTEA